MKRIMTGVGALIVIAAGAAATADEAGVPAPFQGDDPTSTLSIRYDDLSAILKAVVLETGRSDRSRAPRARPAAASRIIRASNSHYSLEGNRIMFTVLEQDRNLAVLTAVRKSLEAVPDSLPLKLLSRDEQLAYWLNLYNVTVLEQITTIYPETRLKRHYVGDQSLWDRKLLTVAGMPLSLNDIHHKILVPKYENPLVMYGLFQGFAGGPNIRSEAYEGGRVMAQLAQNAEEFVNSNRGMHRRDRLMKVSHLYEVNRDLFPNWDADLRRHLRRYADGVYQDRIKSASRFAPSITNYAIADIHNGYKGRGTSVSTNPAALLGAIKSAGDDGTSAEGHFGPTSYVANDGAVFSAGVTPYLQGQSQYGGRFPIHVVEYLKTIEERRRTNKEGEVSIEEYDESPPE
ncbi:MULTISPECIES: DUF547 domain-containing protein [Kordiimonas]|uniref:DUF547 domain-containing protein n=1 Tax=Kordiimonas TaxID=288021 RepID=UPI00257BE91F|nr:DUF547 domain-containing protein [Kordiimonas sp. UBA4487]